MNESPQVIQYLRYLDTHRKSVQDAWVQFRRAFPDIPAVTNMEYRKKIDSLIQSHDMSKFSPEEFGPYRLHWYPAPGEPADEKGYDEAWKLHKSHNPHHYEYWTPDKFKLSRDLPYLMEMICDWISCSRVNGEPHAFDWFVENRPKIEMHLPSSATAVLYHFLYQLKQAGV